RGATLNRALRPSGNGRRSAACGFAFGRAPLAAGDDQLVLFVPGSEQGLVRARQRAGVHGTALPHAHVEGDPDITLPTIVKWGLEHTHLRLCVFRLTQSRRDTLSLVKRRATGTPV